MQILPQLAYNMLINDDKVRLGPISNNTSANNSNNKKLSYCWETVRRESMPRIAEMDVEMTT